MGPASEALSLCLQLQDIKELATNFQGNGSSDNTSDEEVAFRSYKSELESRIRAYQSVAYRLSGEVQAAMALAMARPPRPSLQFVLFLVLPLPLFLRLLELQPLQCHPLKLL